MAHLGPPDIDMQAPPPPNLLRRRTSQGSAILDSLGPDMFPPQHAPMAVMALEDAEMIILGSLLKGCVQIFVNQVIPSSAQPWTKNPPRSITGTGFVANVALRLIVTNAHCVEFAKTILLRKTGDAQKHEAYLLSINHQCDLAILTVPDDAFWVEAVEIEVGEMPRMQQKVDVIGYPIGGDTVSIVVLSHALIGKAMLSLGVKNIFAFRY